METAQEQTLRYVPNFYESSGTPVNDSVANETAFYAAAHTDTPIEDFQIIQEDLRIKGESSRLDLIKKAIAEEHDIAVKQYMTKVLNDTSLPKEQKLNALRQYAIGGIVPPSLKESYAEHVTTVETSNYYDDIVAQERVTALLYPRLNNQTVQEAAEKNEKGSITLMDRFKGTSAVLSGIVASIPAGYGGILAGIMERDPEAAEQVIKNIQNKFTYSPESFGAQEVIKSILEVAEYLQVPAKWIGGKTLEATGSPAAATGAELVLDPLNFIPVGAAIKYFKKPLVRIPAGSPLNTTNAANPQLAVQQGAAALKSSQVAGAANTSSGAILSEWVLPKIDPELVTNYPNLAHKLDLFHKDIRENFEYFSRSPFFVKDRGDVKDTITDVLNNNSGPVYQQANSSVYEMNVPIIDGLYSMQGRAMLGRTDTNGYRTINQAVLAEQHFKTLTAHLPPDLQGTTRILTKNGEHFIQWDWSKKFDPLASLSMGVEATGLLGGDWSRLARSQLGWFLGQTNRFKPWITQGASEAQKSTAFVESRFFREMNEAWGNLRHPEALHTLMVEAEQRGKWFSPSEISAKFPDLSKKELEQLVYAYSFKRSLEQLEHNFVNRSVRNDLHHKGYQVIVDNNGQNIYGFATTKIDTADYNRAAHVIDGDTGNIVTKSSIGNREIVMLKEPLVIASARGGSEETFKYLALGYKNKKAPLPTTVLPRIEGYTPRKYKERWVVDAIPKLLKVDGVVADEATRLGSQNSVAMASSKKEAEQLMAQYQQTMPNHEIRIRQDRNDIDAQVLMDYQFMEQRLRHSMQRGAPLQTSRGPAKTEDPVTAWYGSVTSAVRSDIMKDYNQLFMDAFVKRYREFLPNNSFPRNKGEFSVPNRPLTESEVAMFKDAQREFEYFSLQQQYATMDDVLWKDLFFYVADVFEKLKIPSEWLRGIGEKGNIPVRSLKKLTTTLALSLNPAGQWIVQPAQLWEMSAMHPVYASTRFPKEFNAVILGLSSRAKAVENTIEGKIIDKMAEKAYGPGYKETIDAIYKSGALQAVDLNMMVHGVFADASHALKKGIGQKTEEAILAAPRFIIHNGRKYGYDAAEATNLIGFWLHARHSWMKDNPGKDWVKAAPEISAKSWDWSQNMATRAGMMPYQEGVLSLFFQFAKVTHSSFMQPFFSKTMTQAEKAKLLVARAVLWGAAGTAFAGFVNWLSEALADYSILDNMGEWKYGVMDRLWNGAFASMSGEESDLNIGVRMSALPETLPILDIVKELARIGKGESAENWRFPFINTMGSVGKAASDVKAVFSAWDDDLLKTDEAFLGSAAIAMELASGFGNSFAALTAYAINDKLTKSGRSIGLEMNTNAIYGKFFGFNLHAEEILWKGQKIMANREQTIAEGGKEIYRQLNVLKTKIGQKDWVDFVMRLQHLTNKFDAPIRDELFEEVMRLDAKAIQKGSVKDSLIYYIYMHHKNESDATMQRLIAAARNIQDEKVQNVLKVLEEMER